MPFIKNAIVLVGKPYTPYVPPQIGEVAAGNSYSLFIDKNTDYIWAWGINNSGQLGNNSTISSRTPVSVLGATKTFCQILAATDHTVALDKNGQVWGWGNNGSGQLGNNSTVSSRTPVSVLGATKTFCKIAAGGNYTAGIDLGGQAWAWGNNGVGQLGINSTVSSRTPVSVLGAVKTFCQISTGVCFTYAIDKNGQAWAWGNNNVGQLGINSTVSSRTPVSVLGATKTFCKISGGSNHGTAIDKNGRVWAWGFNNVGQLGNNSTTSRMTPVSILGATKTFCQIFAGSLHTVALDKNGQVWAWGSNGFGQLGNASFNDALTPVSIAGAKKTFCKISAGYSHTLAVDRNGEVWAWGASGFGQLGNNSALPHTPVSVLGVIKTFCQITGGGSHTVAIDKNGQVWSWGYNNNGQLGDNTTSNKETPITIVGTTKTFCQVVAFFLHCTTLAIDKNGKAWAWGNNSLGQLGINSTVSSRTPVSVLGATKTFCNIAAGNGFFVVIDKNGQGWAWGFNNSGQLGDNSITSRMTPVSILGATKTFCQIAGGNIHAGAIDKNGQVWGWGNNGSGQLGNNSTISSRTPVSVLGATKTFCKISAGNNHFVAIDKNGRVWAWGLNSFGQLGINVTTSRMTPVSVLGVIKTFCQIAGGGSHTVAIDKNGQVWSWGFNGSGQLGNNSTVSARTPVSIFGATKTFCKITTGGDYTMAIDNNGRAWGWGVNTVGQLGNEQGNRTTPVRVCNL